MTETLTPPAGDNASVRPLGRGWWALSVVALAGVLAAWLLATPLLDAPDEPSHIVAAVADAHLDWHRTADPDHEPARQIVRVAGTYGLTESEATCLGLVGSPGNCTIPARACRYFFPLEPRCSLPLLDEPHVRDAMTYSGRYPPLYLSLVGLPSLASSTPSSVYAMRVISALLNGALLVAALVALVRWARRPMMLVGLLGALTPVVWGLSVVVNPNGLEATAAIALWASGLALVGLEDETPRLLVGIVALSAIALCCARPLSALWLAIIVGILAIIASPARRRSLLGSRAMRWWGLVVGFVMAASVVWVVLMDSTLVLMVKVTPTHQRSMLLNLLIGYAYSGTWLHQMVGVLGWDNAAIPPVAYGAWLLVAAALLIVGIRGLRRAPRRLVVASVLLVLTTLSLPSLISLATWRPPEIEYFGRYGLAVGVGVLLVAGWLARERSALVRPLSVTMVIVLGVANAASLLGELHRFTVGPNGPLSLHAAVPGAWQPPIDAWLVALLGVVSIAVLSTQLCRVILRSAPEVLEAT